MSNVTSSTLITTLAIIQLQLTRSAYPLWMLFGITGCLLNLFIFSRRKLRHTTCCVYFFAASVDHLMTLIIGIGPVLYALNNPDPQVNFLWFCKLRGYLFQICLMLSRWYVAFACVDRYVLSSEQVRLRNFATMKMTFRVIIVVIVFWSIICSHRLIFYEIRGNLCAILTNMPAALYHSLYVIIGGGILPAMIMVICAALIHQNIQRKNQRQLNMTTREKRRSQFENQVHSLLFIQVIFYMIFTLPQLGNLVFNTISITFPERSREHLAIERFVNFFAEVMLYLFPVTSFYLYTLTSRTFRSELMKFLRLLLGRRSRIGATSEASTYTARFTVA